MTLKDLARRQGFRQGTLLAVLLLATLLFPKSTPLGVYGIGVTAGVLVALQALAIVLIYRANRIINFSQVAVGAFGAYVFSLSASYRPALRWLSFLCGADGCGSLAIAINYWASFVVGLALSVLLVGVVYYLVVRRFVTAPRILITVATVFVAPALYSMSGLVTGWLSTDADRRDGTFGGENTAFPVDWSFRFGGTVFRAIDVLMVVAALVITVALFVYLTRSRTGVAIRAAAENPDRASTLGIDVGGVTLRIWLIAGGLSGMASLLLVIANDAPPLGVSVDSELLTLTAAAIAGLTSLPMAVVASVALGMVKQSVFWAFGNTSPLTGSLIMVLGATFLLQSVTASRGEVELASTLATGREVRAVPRELSGLPAIKLWRRSIAVPLALLLLGMPALLSPAQVDQLTTVLVFGIIALSLLVLTGWAGQISLGQVGFAGIGAYTMAVSGLPVYLGVPLGIMAGAASAAVIGVPALRLRGLHLAIISLAFSVLVSDLIIEPRYGGQALPTDIPRPQPFGIDFEDARIFYYLVLLAVVVTTVMLMGLRRSRLARALIAGRDNEIAAQALGVPLVRARIAAFAVSGGVAAFGGTLLAYQQHAVQAATFDASQGLNVFVTAVFGGMGHISGPLLGTALLRLPGVFLLPAFITTFVSGGLALLLVLTVPGGLAQALFDARDNLLRRLAKREGISVPSLEGTGADTRDGVAQLLPRADAIDAEVYVPVRYRLRGQWALAGQGRPPESNHE